MYIYSFADDFIKKREKQFGKKDEEEHKLE